MSEHHVNLSLVGNRVIAVSEPISEELRATYERIEELEIVLREALLQIEYLHEKFQPTGSGEAILARVNATLWETV